jgi:hypothetical protein
MLGKWNIYLVEDVESVASIHENLTVVFIDRTLGVTDGWDVLDNDLRCGMDA